MTPLCHPPIKRRFQTPESGARVLFARIKKDQITQHQKTGDTPVWLPLELRPPAAWLAKLRDWQGFPAFIPLRDFNPPT
jgi:hypothetical protein